MIEAATSKPLWRQILCGVTWLILLIAILVAGFLFYNRDLIQRVFLGGLRVYETTPPALPADIKRPAILVFSKTNGFRHDEAIPAANAMFAQMARNNGWGYFHTENGAAFKPEILSKFDAVIFNNASGDVFNAEQKTAFRVFVENGGGYVGIHAAGDDSHSWDWFVTHLIGTKFIGHPIDPQFQKATVRIEEKTHAASRVLPNAWDRTDEWYSFDASPRAKGFRILATLDEATYRQVGLFGNDIGMGKDHPVMWWNCVGKGRMLYSALGHTAESYSEPLYRDALQGAVQWAIKRDPAECNDAVSGKKAIR